MNEENIKIINQFVAESGLMLYSEYREHILYLILTSYLKSMDYEVNETFTWIEFNNYKRGYTLPIKKQSYISIDKMYNCIQEYFDKADIQLLCKVSLEFPENNKCKMSADEFYEYCKEVVTSEDSKEIVELLKYTSSSSARLYIFLIAVDVMYTKFGIELCGSDRFRNGLWSFDYFYKRIEDGTIYEDITNEYVNVYASKSAVANRYQKCILAKVYEHLNSEVDANSMDRLWYSLENIADKSNAGNRNILEYIDDLLGLFYTVSKQCNKYTVMLYTFQQDECKSTEINTIDEVIRKILKCVEVEYGVIIEFKERNVGVQLKLENIVLYDDIFDFSDYAFIEEVWFHPAMTIRVTHDFKVVLDGRAYSKDIKNINELISNREIRRDKSILCADAIIGKACRDEGSYEYRSSFISAMMYLYELYSRYSNICVLNRLNEIQISEDDGNRISELGKIKFKFWEWSYYGYKLVQLKDDEAIDWFHAIQELELLYKKVEKENYVIKEQRGGFSKFVEKALLWYRDVREVLLGTLPFLLGVISGASTQMIIILLLVGLVFTRSVMKFDNFSVYNLVSIIKDEKRKR